MILIKKLFFYIYFYQNKNYYHKPGIAWVQIQVYIYIYIKNDSYNKNYWFSSLEKIKKTLSLTEYQVIISNGNNEFWKDIKIKVKCFIELNFAHFIKKKNSSDLISNFRLMKTQRLKL